jgi:hypothetical protein
MGLLFRFEDERQLFESVPGCPLAAVAPSTECSACARCRFNAAWSGQAAPGCHVDLPLDVWEAASEQLLKSEAALHAVMVALRRAGPTYSPDQAQTWEKLAHAFNALATQTGAPDAAAACREVASTVHAFAQSARHTGRAVRVAE